MKKNYKYLLLGFVSLSSLILVSVIPLILNSNDAAKNFSAKNEQLEKEKKPFAKNTNPKMNKKQSTIQKPNPKMNKKQSTIQKPNPKMNKKQSTIQKPNPKMNRLKSKDWYKQNRKAVNLNHHKVGLSKIYDITGMKIKYDNYKNINITYVHPNSIANKSGIQLNDKIISINSITLSGMQSLDIAKLIYRSENKTVNFLIERQGENITISLKI